MPDVSVASSTIAAGVLLGGMLGLIALGLSIILGVMRLVNLAHGEFLLVGAYSGLFFVQASGRRSARRAPCGRDLRRRAVDPALSLSSSAARRSRCGSADDDDVCGFDHPAERFRARFQRRYALDPGTLRRSAADVRPRNRAPHVCDRLRHLGGRGASRSIGWCHAPLSAAISVRAPQTPPPRRRLASTSVACRC